MGNQCLLSVSHPAYGVLLEQAEPTETLLLQASVHLQALHGLT